MGKKYRRSMLDPSQVLAHKQCNTPLEKRLTKSRAERYDYCPTCKKFINEFLDRIWILEPKETEKE